MITALDNGRILAGFKTDHTFVIIEFALDQGMFGDRLLRPILCSRLKWNPKRLKQMRDLIGSDPWFSLSSQIKTSE